MLRPAKIAVAKTNIPNEIYIIGINDKYQL